MKPLRFKSKSFKDKRGTLIEIVPLKIKKKFTYAIFTDSKKNVLRGMHFNKKMDEEKLIYVLEGSIFDVTINLNKGKKFGETFYFKLKKNDILLIPKGFAHGYLCLKKTNSILYLLSKKYSNANSSGFCWNDKNFRIKWKLKRPILSNRDKNLKEYKI